MGADPLTTWLVGRAIRGFEQFVYTRLFTPVTTCGPCVCPPPPDLEPIRSACLEKAAPQPGDIQISLNLLLLLILGALLWGLIIGLIVGWGACWASRSRAQKEVARGPTWAPASPPGGRSEASFSTSASGRGPGSPSGKWLLQQ